MSTTAGISGKQSPLCAQRAFSPHLWPGNGVSVGRFWLLIFPPCLCPCRYGKILEDLDAMAGAISYKHCDDGKTDSTPLTIVTASVDRIDFLKPWGIKDLRLSGHVTFVGYSSMEGKTISRLLAFSSKEA